MDTGLLIFRIIIGALMAGHGLQKLFGWFDGDGPRGTSEYLESLGYRPGVLFMLLAGLSEFAAGVLLGFGLLTPVGGAILVSTMINVYSGHEGKGLWNDKGGWELPMTLGAIGGLLAFTGAGGYSLDSAIGWGLSGTGWGIAAVIAGALGGLGAQVTRRRFVEEPAMV